MHRTARLGGGAALAVAAVAGAGAYVVARVQSRPPGDVRAFLTSRPGGSERSAPVVCAGASIVRGRASVDFVEMLRARQPQTAFVNAGVNGNLAWELLQRLDDVLACAPRAVVILVGTNDVQATLSRRAADAVRRRKRLPEAPSLAWYARCLGQIVDDLTSTGATVGLCSLPPLGQDLGDTSNIRVREFNAEIARVARERSAAYLPVSESMIEFLHARGADAGPAWTGSPWPGVRSLAGRFLLGRSYDEIAGRAGWLLSPDGVHLDTDGARIVADLAEAFLSPAGGRRAV